MISFINCQHVQDPNGPKTGRCHLLMKMWYHHRGRKEGKSEEHGKNIFFADIQNKLKEKLVQVGKTNWHSSLSTAGVCLLSVCSLFTSIWVDHALDKV